MLSSPVNFWVRGAIIVLVALQVLPCSAAAGAGVCNVPRRPANLGFTLADVAGNEVRLSDYKERVVLINFWATWCVPCRKEIPWLIELYDSYRERGFVVLGVSMDDVVARIGPFAAALHMNYPVLVGAGESEFKESFGPLLGFPTSLLLARDGSICVRHTGITRKEELERGIRALL